MEDVAVEVCGENGAYYKAYITDVHEDEVTVAFEKDWQPESKFPFNRVRLPPAPPKDDKPISMIEGQEVEVFSRASEQEACGWWRAVVKMTKCDFHVVKYLGWETTYTDIVPSDRLRLKNTNQPITKGTFHQFEIPVPEDVQEHSKLETAHTELKKAIGAAVCKYNAEKKCLLFIFFSSQGRQDGLKKRACMLSDKHFRNLRQKVLLLTRTEEAARQLESTRLHSNSGYGEEFTVREDLMGLAIGAHGANIQNARKLEGITGIDLEECSCTFKIFGEDSMQPLTPALNDKNTELSTPSKWRWQKKRKVATPSSRMAAMAVADLSRVNAEFTQKKVETELKQKKELHDVNMRMKEEESILKKEKHELELTALKEKMELEKAIIREKAELEMAVLTAKMDLIETIKESVTNGTFKNINSVI